MQKQNTLIGLSVGLFVIGPGVSGLLQVLNDSLLHLASAFASHYSRRMRLARAQTVEKFIHSYKGFFDGQTVKVNLWTAAIRLLIFFTHD